MSRIVPFPQPGRPAPRVDEDDIEAIRRERDGYAQHYDGGRRKGVAKERARRREAEAQRDKAVVERDEAVTALAQRDNVLVRVAHAFDMLAAHHNTMLFEVGREPLPDLRQQYLGLSDDAFDEFALEVAQIAADIAERNRS